MEYPLQVSISPYFGSFRDKFSLSLSVNPDPGLQEQAFQIALWAFKNLLSKSSTEQKQTTTTVLGWNTLSRYWSPLTQAPSEIDTLAVCR